MTLETIRRLVCAHLCKPEEEPHLCKPEEEPHPFSILRHRTGQHIREVLHRQYPGARLHIRDRAYSTLNLQEFNRWIQKDCVSERQYFADWHDCDDFADAIRCKIVPIAHSLKTTLVVTYSEGYNPTDYHAFNMLLDTHDRIFIIEPQDDAVVPADESVYLPDFIFL